MGRWIAAGETEGCSTLAISNHALGHILCRFQHLSGGYPHDFNPVFVQPGIALFITLGPITHVMCNSVNLKSDLRHGAVKIENIWSYRVLATKVDTVRRSLEQAPEQGFGKREVFAQFARQ